MSIPELDLKKVNLQSAVGYLISLHDNEVDWNLLGIRVIGAIDALPIPEGNYEYGDAYMVGTETPYDMYIYTRPDGEVHTEGYWFPVGKFPMPGPKGDKGDGLEQINKWTNGTVSNVTYDTTDGAKVIQTTTVNYTDSTDGSTKQQQFDTTTTLPIVPGKYISMNATSDNKKMEVKVDDTALALDYIKIDKTAQSAVPQYADGKIKWTKVTGAPIGASIVARDDYGATYLNDVYVTNYLKDPNNSIYNVSVSQLYFTAVNNVMAIDKTPTDTGTMELGYYSRLIAYPDTRIEYDGQLYYRMDPNNAPDGTFNLIHIDSIDDGNGGYKATGKCFSITISTRAWQVFDLDFGGSTRTTHNLTLTDSSTGMSIYFSLTNNRPETYEGAPVGLLAALENNQIACTVDANGTYSAGMITTDGTNLKVTYGNGEEALIEQMQVSITDNMV